MSDFPETNFSEPLVFTEAEFNPLNSSSLLEESKKEQGALTLDLELTPLETTTLSDRREIVFIDSNIADVNNLITGINPNAEIIRLETGKDGIEKISEVLAQRQDISGVHIVSHGSAGSLDLGSTKLSYENIEEYGDILQQWGSSLSERADILLYGCDVAQGAVGEAFVSKFSTFTGADVAASDDLTGNTVYGGDDWLLEYETGNIETNAFSGNSNFTEVLGTVSLTNNKLLFDEDAKDHNINVSFDASNNLIIRDNLGEFITAQGITDLDNNNSSVTLNWSNLSFNNFEINTNEVTFASNLFLNGASLNVKAENITVNSGVTLSTRKISGSDHLNDLSTGDSGNINFTINETFGGGEIIIGKVGEAQAQILTHAKNENDTTYTDGNINFSVAKDVVGSVIVDIDTAESKVELNNTTVRGGEVNLTAIAGKAFSFNNDSPPQETNLIEKFQGIDFLADESGGTIAVVAGVVVADSTAEVLVNSSNITATDLNISAQAKAAGKINPLGNISFGVGVGVGDVDSTARAKIDSNSTINVDNKFTLESNTENDVNIIGSPAPISKEVTGDSQSQEKTLGLAAGIAVTNSDMESIAQIAQGANIAVGNLDVSALSKEKHEVEANGAALQDGRLGIAVAISDSDSTTKALVDGNVTSTKDILISAKSDKENSTSATSKIGSNIIEQAIGEIAEKNAFTKGFDGILDFNASASRSVAEFLNKKLQKSLGDYKFLEEYGLSASVAVVNDDSDTVARIGDGAKVNSNGNIMVNAEAEITPYTSATAIANSRVEPNKSKRTSRDYAGSGAVQVNNFDTTAKAYIGKNAIVNATDSLSVTSNTKYPYDPSIIGFIGEGLGYVTSSLPTLLGTVVDNATEAVTETYSPGQTFTSWTRSAATGAKEMGLGVSVSYFDIANNSSAYIDEGAQINQTPGYSSAVSIKATSEVETVNVAGVLGIPYIEERVGVPEEVAGVGGTVLVIDNSNNVSAVIHDGVKIKAKTVEVDSKTAAKQLTIGVSGGEAETVGVNGTVSVLSIENNTIAQIDSGAQIVTGSNTFSGTNVNIKVNAVDDSRIIGISGGVAAAKNVGIGFSVGVNDLKRNTQAVIGNIADATTQGIVNQAVTGTFIENTALETDTGGSVTSGKDITVNSNNTGYTVSLALAGAVAFNTANNSNQTSIVPSQSQTLPATNPPATNPPTTNPPTTNSTTTSVFGKVKTALEGIYIKVSGEWLDNDVHDDTKAYIKNATITAANVDVNALNDSDVWAWAGGVALNHNSGSSGSSGGSKVSLGFAGSWSDNFIEGETSAYLDSSTATLSQGKLNVSAITNRDIKSLAASGSGVINQGTTSSFSGTLAGSVTNNEITNQTLAYLKNTTVESLNLSVTAKDTSYILSVAGAVAVTISTGSGSSNPGGSIGASWADNEVASSTLAYLENSTAKVATNIAISAENSSDISTLSATLGLTNQTGAFAASVSINDIDNNTKAYINGGLVTEGDSSNKTDSISLSAKDTSVINAISGSGGAADKAGVGFAFAWNDIENKTESYINAARINEVEGDIAITAISEAKIKTFAIGGSFGSTAAVAGSTSINQIENETNAYLAAANLDKTKNLNLTAKDSSTILALGGGISASDQGFAVGAAIAINEIGDSHKRVQAYIKGGTVNATENVKLEAKVNSRILAITAGGSKAESFSLGGSLSVNYLSINPTAYIEGGAIVNADGNIAITADSELELDLIAGGVGIAKNTAVGIGTTILTTENTVAAYISGETTQVNAKGNGIGVTFFNGERDDNGNKFITTANGLIVLAHNYDDILNVAAAGAFSESKAAGAGSATVNTILNTTKAYLDDRVKINQNVSAANAAQSIYVFAWDEADLNNVAGSLAFTGGSTGLAGGVNVGVISRTTEAYIGVAALVDAKNNIYVNALNTDEITPIAASVGVAKTAGVGGSVSVLVINENTKAYIGNDAVVRANNNIVVDADSRSEIDLVAGSVGGSEKVGVGVSADVPVINKTTESYIGTNAQVTALALGDAVAVSTGEFESKYLPVQTAKFGASNINFSNETITFSENHGFRTGDIVIFGKNSSGAIAGLTDKEIYYVVVIDNKNIKLAKSLADVLDNKYVDFTGGSGSNHILQSVADAETKDVASQTGRSFGSDKVSSSNHSVNFGQKHGLITGQAITYSNVSGTAIGGLENGKTYYVIADANNSNVIKFATSRANAEAGIAIDITSQDSGSKHHLQFIPNGKQITTPKTQFIKGLAVTSTSTNDMMNIGAAGGVAGSADVSLGVALGASVYVLNNQTKAHIDSSAKINQNNADAGTEQSVHVVAGSDVDILGIGGVLAVGAAQVGGAAAPGANVTVVNNTTEAYVGQLATVNARQDVRVEATAKEDIFGLAASLAGSGGEVAVSLAGSASVFALKNKTHAFLGQDTQVNAGGNVLVRAKDDTELDSIAGSIGLAIGIGGGLGGSAGVIVLEKDTQAYIGDRSIVNAAGNGNSTINVIKNDNTGTEAIRGIGVQATSTEDIFTLAAAGGGGLVGIAGAVTVTNIDSDTKAYVGLNARLNQNNQNASNEQTVNVTSTNKSEITTGAGSLALGLVGINGGVDIGTIQNNTTAYINDGSQVAAKKDLTVNAFSNQDIDSNAINFGAGGIGIAGSVAVYAIGTKLNADSQQAIKSSQGDTIQYANDLFKPSSSLTETLNSYNNQSDLSNLQGNVGTTTTTQIQNGTSGDRVKTAFARQEVEGTTAFIGKNVTVTTGRDINVKADAKLDLDALAGGAAIGGAGIGGSVVVANINNTVLAYTDESSQLNAVNNINVKANNNEIVEATTYGGQGGTVGLGASVAKITLNRDVRAYLANNTKVNLANNLNVSADTVSNLTANALNLSIGFIAAGVSWGSVNSTGFTKAYLGDGVTVNNTQNLDIKARSQDKATTKSNASSGGLTLNGSGSIAEINLTPTVEAYIGANANLTLTSNANIEAQAQGEVTSEAKGVQVSGGIGVGISDAEANWKPTVFASVGNSTQLNANDITIKAFTPNNTNNTNNTVNASAYPSAGSLLGSGVGADAETRIDSKVLANVGEKAKLNASNNLNLIADSYNQGDAKANGKVAGLFVGAGSSDSSVQIVNLTKATTAADVELKVNKTIKIDAKSTNNGTSEAIAGAAGAISLSGSDALMNLTNVTTAGLGDRTKINSDQNIDSLNGQNRQLLMYANSNINLNTKVEQDVDGLGSGNYVEGNTSVSSNTDTKIGTEAQVKVNNLTLDAKENNVSIKTDARAETIAVGSDVDAEAIQNTTLNTKTSIASKAKIVVRDNLNVSATQTLSDIKGFSEVKSYGAGFDDADSTNILKATAEISADRTVGIEKNNNSPQTTVNTNVSVTPSPTGFSNFASDEDFNGFSFFSGELRTNNGTTTTKDERKSLNNFNPFIGSSTVVVDTLKDDYYSYEAGTSLREAIAQVIPGGTITFAPSLAGGTIVLEDEFTFVNLPTPQLEITKDLTIDGGNANITIKGKNVNRIFNINDNNNGNDLTVTISGLTLTDGYSSSSGGAIYNAEDLTLRDVNIANNRSNSDGGGVYNEGLGLALENTTFTNNRANRGGGVYNNQGLGLTLEKTTFTNNLADNSGGAIVSDGTSFFGFPTFVIINNSSFSNNQANNSGGAILDVGLNWMFITDTSFSNNQAKANSINGLGGAIYKTSDTDLDLYNVNFENNSAYGGGGIRSEAGTVSVTNSSFINNNTQYGGGISNSGANVTLSQVTIGGNSASTEGGGIWQGIGNLSIRNSTIAKNTSDNGGGVYTEGTNSTKVFSSIIAGNTKTDNITKDDVSGSSFISEGYNLVGEGSGLSKFGQPMLDTLQDPIDFIQSPNYSAVYNFITDSLAKESNSTSGNGLPDNGYFAANADHPEVQLGYSSREEDTNAVRVLGQQSVTHTLAQSEQNSYQTLHLLATSTQGKTGIEVEVTYSDGTVSTVQQIVPDWFDDPGIDAYVPDDIDNFPQGVYTLFNGADRIETTNLSTEGLADANDAAIFGLKVSIDPNKTLEKITVVNQDTPKNDQGAIDPSNLIIFGMTAETAANQAVQLDISALFNKDVIANKFSSDRFVVDENDLKLGSLTKNKNGTYIYPLLPGSVALDGGTNPDNLQLDQSNNFRINNARIDIGAYEAQHNSIVVDTLSDTDDGIFSEGNLSLREAILHSDSGSTITFSSELADSTIALGEGELNINRNLTIDGGNTNITITGLGNSRIFNINDSQTTAINVNLKNLNLTEGFTDQFGGAIFNSENLTITNSDIFNNQASRSGGGIANHTGSLTLLNTTVYNNQASQGGGGIWTGDFDVWTKNIQELKTATLLISNSTISGNSAYSGGGILNVYGETTIKNSTISHNSAQPGTDTSGGIDGYEFSTIKLSSTIVADNINGDVSASVTNFNGSYSSDGYNLIEEGWVDYLSKTGDIIGVDAKLAPLADNGGDTMTHALLPGSPALDAGNNPNSLTTDRRGEKRVSGSKIDIGAYEAVNQPPILTLQNQLISLIEGTEIPGGEPLRIADLIIDDDGIGTKDNLYLTGSDADKFELILGATTPYLVLKSRTVLDYETQSQLQVTININDSTIQGDPDNSATYTLIISDRIANELKVDTLVDEQDGDYGFGDFSLREALQLLDDGGTITFDSTLEGETLTLTQGELVLDRNLTILGDGITLSGNNNRIFKVDDGKNSTVNVTLHDFNLTDGFSNQDGGAIFNSENLTITGSNIFDNQAIDDGGAIFNQENLTIIDSSLYNNRSIDNSQTETEENATKNHGGAIFTIDSTLNLSQVTISSNSARNDGGAIFVDNSMVSIHNSTITNNGISSSFLSEFYSNGILSQNNSQVKIASSIITGNKAQDAPSYISSSGNLDGSYFINEGNNLIGDGSYDGDDFRENDKVQNSIDNSNFALLTESAAKALSSNGNGLPDNAYFYQYSPKENYDYTEVRLKYHSQENNARILTQEDSFNFSVPQKNYQRIDLFLLATEGNGDTQVQFTYTDGTKDTFTRTVPDWFSDELPDNTYYLIDNLDRAKIDATGFEDSNNPAIFGLRFDLNVSKQVQNISVSNTDNNGSYVVFFGATGTDSGNETTDLNVSSVLNKDVIIDKLSPITNPQLAPLQDNGSGIMTHSLLPNSPAINAGSNPNNLTTDTRGLPRTQGNQIDIGAVEMQPVNVDLDSTTEGINYTTTFVEDESEAIAIVPNPTITDADLNDSIKEIKVTLTNRLDATSEGLSINGAFGSIGTVQLNNVKEIVLTGLNATHTEVENLLKAITYNNSSDTPNISDRSIQITVSDGILTSPVAVTTVQIESANDVPTLTLENTVTTIPENTVIATPLKVADLNITDDNEGTNNLTLTGIDASKFEIVDNELFLKAGTILDYETQQQLQVTVNLEDPTLGNNSEDSETLTIAISDVPEFPEINLKQGLTSLPSGSIQNFGSMDINSGFIEHIFAIENTGNAPLNLNNLTLNASDFSLMNNLSNQEIAAGANLELTIRFQPQQTGDRTTTLTIFNNDSNESIYTLTLQGTAISTKNITGTDSNDTITINSPTSNSIVNAGNGNDLVNGNNGSEYILAGSGSDRIDGGAGNDRLFGDEGDDRIDGGTGNDLLRGGDGRDLLLGKEGSDNLVGDGGDDYLDGGTQNDLLRGSTGNDTFVLSANQSIDTIYDFNVNEDRFELNGLEVSQLSFTNSGSNCSIAVGSQIIAKVLNVTAAQLTEYFQTKYQQ